jgi:dihydroorotate dehydrogenase electron transfer subunit
MSDSPPAITKGIYDCPILSIDQVAHHTHLMRMHCPAIARSGRPAQFINIKVNNDLIPLLRKPFSICRLDAGAGWIEVLWKIVGKGTQIMANYQIGQTVNIIGPLGRGFQLPPDLELAFLVGGGLGVAPFPFFCQTLLEAGVSAEVFLGTRSKNELTFVDEFQQMGVEVFVSTDDGSVGRRGLVTESVIARIQEIGASPHQCLFSCGPTPFLNAMIEISRKFDIDGQLSLETMMGCGFGICVGCPVETLDPLPGEKLYPLTCMDGPVFNAGKVKLHD